MRTAILILLVALALASVASAEQINVTVTSTMNNGNGDDGWLVANAKDTATVTVTVIDSAGPNAGLPFEGANVSFSVNSPWQLKDTHIVTDDTGVVSTTLLSTKTSGTANITIQVDALKLTELFGWVNYTEIRQVSVPIDHTTPWSITTIYKNQVQVHTPTPISVYVKDKNGNPVDNRLDAETVRFVTSASGIEAFYANGSWVKSITVPVNESGYANVQFMADLGINIVMITPPTPINIKLITIEGTSTGVPFTIDTQISPGGSPYPYTTINSGVFTIGYTLYDQNGYPTANQQVNITTSLGESILATTNKYGAVVFTYGPKDKAAVYTINATSVSNRSVRDSRQVEFISGEAVDALLTASPQSMASRDVQDDLKSVLVMRVMDVKGNPVANEPVRFSLLPPVVKALCNETVDPYLRDTVTGLTGVDLSVMSDTDGEATVEFHPGKFTTDTSPGAGYNATADARATVVAQWSSVSRQVTLRYMNFPYLTIETDVSPTTLRMNESVTLTVRVVGDGYALQPKPIRVILVNDRSGSMTSDSPDRIWSVMKASKEFVDNMTPSKDKVGLVTFGDSGTITSYSSGDCDHTYTVPKTYADSASLDAPLGAAFTRVKTAISSMVPSGNTPTRYALKVAIDELVANTSVNENAVKAVILLSDGEYNKYGDPLARKTFSSSWPTDPDSISDNLDSRWIKFTTSPQIPQNMSDYAVKNNIRIFTIGMGSSQTPEMELNLSLLAQTSGGTYYSAKKSSDLAAIYTSIAGALQDTAGMNTTMNLSFQNIMVGNVTMPGNKTYAYQRVTGISTRETVGNTSTVPIKGFPKGYPKEYDSSGTWNARQQLDFNIGTIHLNQTWQSTVVLKVLQEGNMNVFDNASKITTADTLTAPMKLPDQYITVIPNSSNVTYGTKHLSIDNLARTNNGSVTSAELKWDITYDGTSSIIEDVMIAPEGTGDWSHLPLKEVASDTHGDIATIQINTLDPGNYTIRVRVDAMDANSDYAEISLTVSGAAQRPQIKIGG